MLTITAAIAAYAAGRVGNGLGPEQARQAVADAAAELEAAAAALRRLARLDRLDPAGRRRLVAELAASGMSQRAIGRAVGVSKRTVWGDLHRLAANEPQPGLTSTSPSSASVAIAFRTVRGAVPSSSANATLEGRRAPGGYSPEAIRPRMIAAT